MFEFSGKAQFSDDKTRLGELTAGIIVSNLVIMPRFFTTTVAPNALRLWSSFGSSKTSPHLRKRTSNEDGQQHLANHQPESVSSTASPHPRHSGFLQLSDDGGGLDGKEGECIDTYNLSVKSYSAPPPSPNALG